MKSSLRCGAAAAAIAGMWISPALAQDQPQVTSGTGADVVTTAQAAPVADAAAQDATVPAGQTPAGQIPDSQAPDGQPVTSPAAEAAAASSPADATPAAMPSAPADGAPVAPPPAQAAPVDDAAAASAQAAERPADTSAAAQRLLTGKPSPAKTADAMSGRKGDGPQASNSSGRLEGDIVVVGFKESAATARNAKRRASQIVDVVMAQDIGKLPDRNVTEAISRLPGVQITRERGEGANVLIRGLSNVMTTVNGSQSFNGSSRGASLAAVSSDLVAAVEVFKTRTPDQIEGSQTGVVNITMRRPTDFKDGSTFALTGGADYADQVRNYNPSFSALVAHSGDSAIGRMGFLVNGSYEYFKYDEAIRWNGYPGRPDDNRQVVDPSTTPADIFMPGAVGFAGRNGNTRRASLNVSTDWKPTDNLRFIMEGGFVNSRYYYSDSNFDIGLFGPLVRLSNVVLDTDGRTVKSVSVDGTEPIGPGRQSRPSEDRNYNGRFQAEYKTDRFEIVSWLNYVRSNREISNIYHWVRYNQQPQFDVVFNTDKDPRGGPDVTFKNIDLLDPNNYRYVDGFTQSRFYSFSREIEAKTDLRLNTFSKFIDYFKFGYRYATRSYEQNNAYRVGTELRVPMSSLPGYSLIKVEPGFAGSAAAANAKWLIGDADRFNRAFPTFVSLIENLNPEFKGLKPRYNWWEFFGGSESSHGVYGMAHYNMKLLFPIEGVVGVRIVNAMNAIRAVSSEKSNVVTDGITEIVERRTPIVSNGNVVDVMPSANATVHFTDNLQLRLSYSRDVGRAQVAQLTPQITFDLSNTGAPTASGGNPDLGAIKTTKYDTSLEWYFGRAGSVSLALWQWNQEGFVQNTTLPEPLAQGAGIPVLVNRPRNLGRGRHRGIEASATTFFSFLPGILKSFGASVNGTLNITRQAFPGVDRDGAKTLIYGPYLLVSKYTYNLQGFFEKDGLNARLAYNWRSRQQRVVSATDPYANEFFDPIERLDASISYDFTKNFSVSVQANNLTRNGEQLYWGSRAFPRDIGYFSREYSARLIARF
jgi:TonB-dependent receptor